MRKLQNVAYEIFVRDYGVNGSAELSNFLDVVSAVDKLGKDLLISNPFFTPSQQERKEYLKRNIDAVISALNELGDLQV